MWQCALQIRKVTENVRRYRLNYLEDLSIEDMRVALTKLNNIL